MRSKAIGEFDEKRWGLELEAYELQKRTHLARAAVCEYDQDRHSQYSYLACAASCEDTMRDIREHCEKMRNR